MWQCFPIAKPARTNRLRFHFVAQFSCIRPGPCHNQDMFTPQYSLRRLLAFMTACGFICLAIAGAGRGLVAAFALIMTLVGLVIILVCLGLMYEITRICGALLLGFLRRRKPKTAAVDGANG